MLKHQSIWNRSVVELVDSTIRSKRFVTAPDECATIALVDASSPSPTEVDWIHFVRIELAHDFHFCRLRSRLVMSLARSQPRVANTSKWPRPSQTHCCRSCPLDFREQRFSAIHNLLIHVPHVSFAIDEPQHGA